jgi:hypothetical protein
MGWGKRACWFCVPVFSAPAAHLESHRLTRALCQMPLMPPPGAMFSAALGCLARALEATSDLRCGRHIFRTVSSMFPRRNQPACAVHFRALGEGETKGAQEGTSRPSAQTRRILLRRLVSIFLYFLNVLSSSHSLNAIPAVWTRNRTPEYLIPILESQLG